MTLAGPLRTTALARLVVHHRTLDSTNDRAMRLARDGAPHGLVVIADQQTAGRGQRGRTWSSAPGAGLYASFVLRPDLAPAEAARITLAAGVGVHKAVQPLVAARLGLKWPNDVLVAEPGADFGQKLAGILFDVVADQDHVLHAVLGIGINLRPPADPALVGATTALSALPAAPGATPVDALTLLARLANALEPELARLQTGGVPEVLTAWTERAIGLGERVEVDQSDGAPIVGQLDGVTEDGGLMLSTAHGRRPVFHGRLRIPGAPYRD